MLNQTFLFLGQLWQLFEVSQILEFLRYYTAKHREQEVSLKKIIVEGYRAVGSLNTKNDSFQSSNFLLLLFFIDFGQW